MTHLSNDWELHNKELDKLSSKYEDFLKNEYFKKFVVWPPKLNSYVMHNEITVMISFLDIWDDDILEVGGCFGNFCRCLHDRVKVKSYTILDTESMLRFSKSFLEHYDVPCNFINVNDYKSLLGKKFNIFISNICISELPAKFSNDLLDNVLPNCNSVFIIDSAKAEFSDWLENKIRNNFVETRFSDVPDLLSTQKKHKIYAGVKVWDKEEVRCLIHL